MYGVTREGIRKKKNKAKKIKQKKKKKRKKKNLKCNFLKAYLPACRHHEINSFRLFKEAKSSLKIMKYFSFFCDLNI